MTGNSLRVGSGMWTYQSARINAHLCHMVSPGTTRPDPLGGPDGALFSDLMRFIATFHAYRTGDRRSRAKGRSAPKFTEGF